MPTAITPPMSDVGLSHDDQTSPRPSAGTRPDATAPATVPRKNGVISDAPAKTTPNSRACAIVAAYLRNAKAAPRSTMPSSANSIGKIKVFMAAANASGNPVHHVTSTKISQTWLASQTGPMLWSIWVRSSAPRASPPAVRSKKPDPKSAPPNKA